MSITGCRWIIRVAIPNDSSALFSKRRWGRDATEAKSLRRLWLRPTKPLFFESICASQHMSGFMRISNTAGAYLLIFPFARGVLVADHARRWLDRGKSNEK